MPNRSSHSNKNDRTSPLSIKPYTMTIQIEKSKQLKTIQQEFQHLFPQLKIEFYKTAHHQGEGSSNNGMLDTHLTFGELSAAGSEGILEIEPVMKVSALEQAFETSFGLHVQVFRKSGNVWLQTVKTDTWTLGQQNQEAIETDKPLAAAEPEDYHEQE